MKKTKISLLLVLAACSTLIYSSCSKDDSEDSCTPPAIEENIIGKWNAALVGEEVEFKSDGSYVDGAEVLLGAEVNGLKYDQRTYRINGDVLTLKVSPATTNDSAVVEYDILENKCNQIKLGLDFGGQVITATLDKK